MAAAAAEAEAAAAAVVAEGADGAEGAVEAEVEAHLAMVGRWPGKTMQQMQPWRRRSDAASPSADHAALRDGARGGISRLERVPSVECLSQLESVPRRPSHVYSEIHNTNTNMVLYVFYIIRPSHVYGEIHHTNTIQ